MNSEQHSTTHLTILRIGQVARAGGVTVQTVRYYEREGLLDTPARSDSGYRLYQASTIARLHFIARARRLGFSLAETRELLSLEMKPTATCGEVEARAQLKLRDLDERIEQLQSMRVALGQLLAQCRGEEPACRCPILRSLESDQRPAAAAPPASEACSPQSEASSSQDRNPSPERRDPHAN